MITIVCRWKAVDIGFEKITLKDNTMRCYFINRPDSPYFESDLFRRVLLYLQEGTHQARLKQTGRMFLMVVDHIKSMQDARRFLQAMHQNLFPNKISSPTANATSES